MIRLKTSSIIWINIIFLFCLSPGFIFDGQVFSSHRSSESEEKRIIRLSPSTLNLFLKCPRCFWLHFNKKSKRPRGIVSSLPGGMDKVIKEYFDKYRLKDELPPELKGKLEGKLMPDLALIKKWRYWQTGLAYKDKETGAVLGGAIDDCLQNGKFYIFLDYKTRRSPPKEGWLVYSEKYYKNQLSCYTLLLKENGYKVKNYAYLIYYFPKVVKENGVVEFDIKIVKININIHEAKKNFLNAVKLLQGEIPPRSPGCEYCNWPVVED